MRQRKHYKAFVADEEMFNAIKAFVMPEPNPKRKDGESLQDFGARIDAYNEFRVDLARRFDALKMEAEREEVV